MKVRQAEPADAPELVRLRGVMLAGMAGSEAEAGHWQVLAEETLRKRLAEPAGSLAAFVVDRPGLPDRPGEPAGLVACAIGVVEQRLGSPESPSGEYGYLFNVVTDPGYRRRGYARACVEAVIEWYRQRGVRKIDLKASGPGEPLYRSLGFEDSSYPLMRLRLP